MGLGNRNPAARHTAGVDTTQWWTFRPGDRVRVVEGFLGTVTAVDDGPYPGDERYEVALDDGLGGGTYSSDELTGAIVPPTAKVASKVEAEQHVASEDYPELAEILVERPPLAHAIQVGASKQATSFSVVDAAGQVVAGPYDNSFEAQDRANEGTGLTVQHAVEYDDVSFDDGWAAGGNSEVEDVRMEVEAAGWLDKKVKQFADNVGYKPYNNFSVDWCRFRRRERCYYPRTLNAEASAEAGYPVWVPEDRGYCPRRSWEDQKVCPAPSQPGPNSGEPDALPDATVSWEEGGQRVSIRSHAALVRMEDLQPGQTIEYDGDERQVARAVHTHSTYDPDAGEQRHWYRVEFADGGVSYHDDGRASVYVVGSKTAGVRLLSIEDLQPGMVVQDPKTHHEKTVERLMQSHYQIAPDEGPDEDGLTYWYYVHFTDGTVSWHQPEGTRFPVLSEMATAASFTDPEMRFHFTAAWRDVQAKAKKIRSEGHVRILSATDGYVVGEVRGDSNIYQSSLMRVPGSKGVAMWECGCAWANYSWARSGRWKKYEGRMCSHALALNYEAASRGWGGKEVKEDRMAPKWRNDPTVPVILPGDARTKPGPWRVSRKTAGRWNVSVDGDEDFSGSLGEFEATTAVEAVQAWATSVGNSIPDDLDAYDLNGDGSVYEVSPSYRGGTLYAERIAMIRSAQIDPSDPEAGMRKVLQECEDGDHTHAGLIIKAVDSGRVLMTQRTPYSEDHDDVYGRWEFPGGGIEEGETAFQAAVREFQEETGLTLPEGYRVVDCYSSGPYLGIVLLVSNEAWTVSANLLDFEVMGIGWFNPDQIDGADLARVEVDKTEWDLVREARLVREAMRRIALPKLKSNPSIEEVVQWYRAIATDEEPSVTRDVVQIANSEAGSVNGLAFRTKAPDSLERKVRDKGIDKGKRGIPPEMWIQDALRYTIVFHPAVFSRQVQDALYRFQEKGYEIVAEENSWAPGDSYSGLHYNLRTPHGVIMELQFHTGESFELKQKTLHPMLEEFRQSTTPLKRRQELWDAMTSYWDAVELPKDVLLFPESVSYPRPIASLQPHPVSTDPAIAAPPAISLEASFRAKVRGIIRTIKAIVGLDKVRLDDDTIVPASQVENADFHPSRGIADFHPHEAALAEDQYEVLPSSRGRSLTHIGEGKSANGQPLALCGTTVAPLHTVWVNAMGAMAQATCERCVTIVRRRTASKTAIETVQHSFLTEQEPADHWGPADKHEADTPEGGVHNGPKDECSLCKTAGADHLLARYTWHGVPYRPDRTLDDHYFAVRGEEIVNDFATREEGDAWAEGKKGVEIVSGRWIRDPWAIDILMGPDSDLPWASASKSASTFDTSSPLGYGDGWVRIEPNTADDPADFHDPLAAPEYLLEPGEGLPMPMVPFWAPWLGYEHVGSLDDAFLFEAKDERFDGVSLDQDDDGWFVKTHRARSDSYETPEDIPQKDVDFIESTGAFLVADEVREIGAAKLAEDPDYLIRHTGVEQVSEYPAVMGGFYEVYDTDNPAHMPEDATEWREDQGAAEWREDQGAAATLHDEPEPALPATDGVTEVTAGIRDDRAYEGPMSPSGTTVAGPSWLAPGASSGSGRYAASKRNNSEIAAMAQRFLKEGAKAFTPAEQATIINEAGVASNLDRLDITGTHYEALEARDHDDEGWLS
jgi:8-oxo-dGTP pyrophosphatase MutT (NUDIX family)